MQMDYLGKLGTLPILQPCHDGLRPFEEGGGGGGGGGCYARLPTFDYLFILLFVYVSDHAITTLFDHHAGFCMHNPNC